MVYHYDGGVELGQIETHSGLFLSDQQRPPPIPEQPVYKQVRTILITEAERVGDRGSESDERPSVANRIF